ncbi:MAG: metallophosphoesterase [Pseudomonadota bacterium]
MPTKLKSPPKRRKPPRPEEELFVVGNIHGCARQLGKLLKDAPKSAQLIFIGDLIDYGPQSERVLKRVEKECAGGAIALMGNHEKLFLNFMEDPARFGPTWLRSGGAATLKSFGIEGITSLSGKREFDYAADRLRAVIHRRTFRWLNNMALQYDSGTVHVVHAAACPKTPINQQTDDARLWGVDGFLIHPRADHEWVVHGDVIVKNPIKKLGRMNIDTGAYRTGRLSAVHIHKKGQDFVTVGP